MSCGMVLLCTQIITHVEPEKWGELGAAVSKYMLGDIKQRDPMPNECVDTLFSWNIWKRNGVHKTDELVDYYEKMVVTLAVAERSGYVYRHVGEATMGWWDDVDKRGYVLTLGFTACPSLTFSSPLAYISPHPMPDKTMTDEFVTGVGAMVWPRMVQVENVKRMLEGIIGRRRPWIVSHNRLIPRSARSTVITFNEGASVDLPWRKRSILGSPLWEVAMRR